MILGCKETRHVAIREDVADAYVEEHVLTWFRSKESARAALVPGADDVEGKIAAAQRLINGYEEQLDEARSLAEDFDETTGRPRLSAASLASLEQRLGPKLDATRKRLRDLTGVSPLLLDMLNAEDPEAVWYGSSAAGGRPGLTLEQKREILRKVVTVRLYRATAAGTRRVDLQRLRLSFAGEPGFRV